MDRNKLFGLFTGTHLTIMAVGAMFVPGAMFAADTFTRVIIQDGGGHQAFITGGKLQVYDPVADPLAGYSRDPKNFVNILRFLTSASCTPIYTVPDGKALILSSVSYNLFPDSGAPQIALYANSPTCDITAAFAAGVAANIQNVYEGLGAGIAFPSGTVIYAQEFSAINSAVELRGYFVPAAAVPAMSAFQTASAKGQNFPLGRHTK